MKSIILDGRKMNTKDTVHSYLKSKLGSPEYRGNNLDALWDVLSTFEECVEIKVIYDVELIKNLSQYGQDVLETFLEAAEDNRNIIVEVRNNYDDGV